MQGAEKYTVLLCVLGIPAVAFALGTENFGDRPIESSPDWPAGTRAMVEGPGLVYSRWVNGGEYFCYKGDVAAFNDALKKFADINAPAHRLIIDYGYGQTKSFEGKEIQFDWRLDITGGISRHAMLKNGETEIDLSPKLTYCLFRDDTKLDELILPENIEAVIPNPDSNAFLDYHLKQALKWRTAKRKWIEFTNTFLNEQRKKLKSTWPAGQELPIGGYVEFQSQLVSKYLPGYQIYLIETNLAGFSKLFAVSADGNVFDLKGGQFSSFDGNGPFKNESFSSFIAKQQIQISDTNAAVEAGKFIEELAFAPDRWMYLQYNSEGFKIFKAWVFSRAGTVDDPNWRWFAEKYDTG